MIGSGRTVGFALVLGSAVLLFAFFGWLLTAFGTGETTSSGLAMGIVLAMAVLLPILGTGIYLLRRGNQEQKTFAQLEQQKKLLNIVLTQGKVTVVELVAELEVPQDDVEAMIQDLVGKQLFSGAINWKTGTLYSVESQSLTKNGKCPNCGGELTFAGKGIIACPYCGSEIFLTKRATSQLQVSGVL